MSRRDVSVSPIVVEALRRHEVRQQEDRPARSARCGDFDLVFTVFDKKPLRPGNFTRDVYHPLLAKAGVPMIRFHDVSHSHTTMLLTAGIHPKVVSARQGHSGIALTLDPHSHVMPGLQEGGG